MNDFQLIDLVSQREAVRDCLRGKSDEEILRWLADRGRLVRQDIAGRAHFHFESHSGRRAIFFFDRGDLVFVGDHTTFV